MRLDFPVRQGFQKWTVQHIAVAEGLVKNWVSFWLTALSPEYRH